MMAWIRVLPWLLLASSGSTHAAAAASAASRFDALPAAQRTEIYRKTDEEFWRRHPELNRSQLKRDSDPRLIKEYMTLRGEVFAASTWPADPANAGRSTSPNGMGAYPRTPLTGQQLEARADAMTAELSRLASEYENAPPARRQQIEARLKQLYPEALHLSNQYLALAQSRGLSGNPGDALPAAPTGADLAGSPAAGSPTGQLIPASSLAVSPQKYLAALAAERENKARIRSEQAQIHAEDAQMQAGYRDEGSAVYTEAELRAGLDLLNGGARVGMAAFAPESLYQGYEGLNSAAESANAIRESKPWDATKKAQSSLKGFGDGLENLPRNSDLQEFMDFYYGDPYSIPEAKPNHFNQFGRVMEGVDLGVNLVDLHKAVQETNTLQAVKEGIDIGANLASLAEGAEKMPALKKAGGVGARVASGLSGAVATGEGVSHIKEAAHDKSAFEQSSDQRIQQSNARARDATTKAQLNQQLAQFLRDLETRSMNGNSSTPPPSQGPNRDYFKTQ